MHIALFPILITALVIEPETFEDQICTGCHHFCHHKW
jgi:hypothetical protein